MAFKDLTTPIEVRDYLLNVLSRTGGKRKESVFLYHYTNIEAVEKIVSGGHLWLGSTKKMNDYLEGEIIDSFDGGNKVFFSSFSRAEENLAMYKMYAPGPNGVMVEMPYNVAQEIVDSIPTEENKSDRRAKKLLRIVRNGVLSTDTVNADVYWAAVAYKSLHSDHIRSETVFNKNLENPLNIKELAGFIKLYGWEYEKEVRLVAVTEKELAEGERVAIPLPKQFSKKINIITGPGFDKNSQKSTIAKFKRLGVHTRDSEYDAMVNL